MKCEEIGTPSEYFISDSDAGRDSADTSGEKLALAIQEIVYENTRASHKEHTDKFAATFEE